MSIVPQLRYSPVNWLIVDWGFNGSNFSECGLPSPPDCVDPPDDTPVCRALPIQEAIDTYDWARWLPEVIVGIEDADEDIAANYVRLAAIEFARGARVLQREVVVELQPGIDRYPVFPYVGEEIVGIIGVKHESGIDCGTCREGRDACGVLNGVEWQLDVARNELILRGQKRHGLFKMLVWSAPTVDACFADQFLYKRFQYEIQIGARLMYVSNVHFRDRALMASLPSGDAFTRAIVTSKNKAVRGASSSRAQPGSGMWGGLSGNFNGRNIGRWRR